MEELGGSMKVCFKLDYATFVFLMFFVCSFSIFDFKLFFTFTIKN